MQYEFECKECGLIFEVNQPMLSDHKASCPQCGKPSQRIYGTLEWIWKGEAYRPDGSRREDKDYAPVMRG